MRFQFTIFLEYFMFIWADLGRCHLRGPISTYLNLSRPSGFSLGLILLTCFIVNPYIKGQRQAFANPPASEVPLLFAFIRYILSELDAAPNQLEEPRLQVGVAARLAYILTSRTIIGVMLATDRQGDLYYFDRLKFTHVVTTSSVSSFQASHFGRRVSFLGQF